MPVVTAIKCGGELPWRGDIGVAIQNMTDFVRILFLDARERQLANRSAERTSKPLKDGFAVENFGAVFSATATIDGNRSSAVITHLIIETIAGRARRSQP